jgi:hypothetical protein
MLAMAISLVVVSALLLFRELYPGQERVPSRNRRRCALEEKKTSSALKGESREITDLFN